MDASVIIPARNAAATLPATLAALAAQETDASYEVIVVDDGSTDETVAVAEAAGARVIRGLGEGPARARNRGVAEATGKVIAFTDADCEPTPGWLAAVLDALSDADLVQGMVTPPPGSQLGPFDRFIWVSSEHGLYETANLAMPRELFERFGGFESILTPRGGKELGEDVWLGWRVRRSGARTRFSEQALVHHAVFPRGPRGYVAERARVRFFCELTERIPELREVFLHQRYFLNARTQKLDAALVGIGLAAIRRRPAALALALPYALEVRREARPAPGYGRAAVGAAQVAADLLGAACLAYGTLKTRTPVL